MRLPPSSWTVLLCSAMPLEAPTAHVAQIPDSGSLDPNPAPHSGSYQATDLCFRNTPPLPALHPNPSPCPTKGATSRLWSSPASTPLRCPCPFRYPPPLTIPDRRTLLSSLRPFHTPFWAPNFFTSLHCCWQVTEPYRSRHGLVGVI